MKIWISFLSNVYHIFSKISLTNVEDMPDKNFHAFISNICLTLFIHSKQYSTKYLVLLWNVSLSKENLWDLDRYKGLQYFPLSTTYANLTLLYIFETFLTFRCIENSMSGNNMCLSRLFLWRCMNVSEMKYRISNTLKLSKCIHKRLIWTSYN